MSERTPHERETLLFSNPEAARNFRETVAERVNREKNSPPARQQTVVGQVIAEEFAAAGEGVGSVKEPWLHTPAEHEEVQQLVDLAFRRDLGAAIAQARRSQHYPRNLDLLHDVLTGEMYALLREGQLNRQPLGGWLIAVLVIILLTLVALLLVTAVF